jgi:hypothetical protein
MAKQFRYPIDKVLEAKRNAAYRALHKAKISFAKIDLQIRTGKKPPDDLVLGYVNEIPADIEWVKEDIREFQRNRRERRLAEEARKADEALFPHAF